MFARYQILLFAFATISVLAVDYSPKILADLKQIDALAVKINVTCQGVQDSTKAFEATSYLQTMKEVFGDATINSNNSHVPSQTSAQEIVDYTSKPLSVDFKAAMACIQQHRRFLSNNVVSTNVRNSLALLKLSFDGFCNAWYLKVPAPTQRTSITGQKKDGDTALDAVIATYPCPNCPL